MITILLDIQDKKIKNKFLSTILDKSDILKMKEG